MCMCVCVWVARGESLALGGAAADVAGGAREPAVHTKQHTGQFSIAHMWHPADIAHRARQSAEWEYSNAQGQPKID